MAVWSTNRFLSMCGLLSGFAFIIWMGRIALILFVILILLAMMIETTGIAQQASMEGKLPYLHYFRFYCYFVVVFFGIGYILREHICQTTIETHFIENMKDIIFVDYHIFLSWFLLQSAFIWFVVNLIVAESQPPTGIQAQLQSQALRNYHVYQIAYLLCFLLCAYFAFIACLILVMDGIIFMIVPMLTVQFNDISAYICGKLFGKHPLCALSPKKTREGYVYAISFTVLIGFMLARMLMCFDSLIQSQKNFNLLNYSSSSPTLTSPMTTMVDTNTNTSVTQLHLLSDHQKNDIYLPHTYSFEIPVFLNSVSNVLKWFGETWNWSWNSNASPMDGVNHFSVEMIPFQFHNLMFSLFASIVGPIGGLFASGLKRVFECNDFGRLIPGHGGITDRMDCELLMVLFCAVYKLSFIDPYYYPSCNHSLVCNPTANGANNRNACGFEHVFNVIHDNPHIFSKNDVLGIIGLLRQ